MVLNLGGVCLLFGVCVFCEHIGFVICFGLVAFYYLFMTLEILGTWLWGIACPPILRPCLARLFLGSLIPSSFHALLFFWVEGGLGVLSRVLFF